jgi:hypothetical protein
VDRCGVDEDRYDHPIGAPLRALHQGKMPGMQRTHGRHQADSLAPRAPSRERMGERRQAVDYLRAPQLRADKTAAHGVADPVPTQRIRDTVNG